MIGRAEYIFPYDMRMNIIVTITVGVRCCSECIKMHHFEGENTQIFLDRVTDSNPIRQASPRTLTSIKKLAKKPYQGFTFEPHWRLCPLIPFVALPNKILFPLPPPDHVRRPSPSRHLQTC